MSISKRIAELNRLDDLIIYRAICSCSQEKHDLTIHLEKDTEFDLLLLTFYVNLSIDEYFSLWEKDNFKGKLKKFIHILWIRIKLSLKVLFTGYIEIEQEFIIDDKDQIDSLVKSLEEGKSYLNIE